MTGAFFVWMGLFRARGPPEPQHVVRARMPGLFSRLENSMAVGDGAKVKDHGASRTKRPRLKQPGLGYESAIEKEGDYLAFFSAVPASSFALAQRAF